MFTWNREFLDVAMAKGISPLLFFLLLFSFFLYPPNRGLTPPFFRGQVACAISRVARGAAPGVERLCEFSRECNFTRKTTNPTYRRL